MNVRSADRPILLSIAAVERDTGIGKDTLRAWERRYGFPTPARDQNDERAYPLEQVEKLRAIKRLLDLGHRPGRVVGLPIEELHRLCMGQTPAPTTIDDIDQDPLTLVKPLYDAIRNHDDEDLRRLLSQAHSAQGLSHFVMNVIAPLNTMVGDGWMRGELQVFEEHLYSETVQTLLRQAINQLPQPSVRNRPRVLLTTFPQEQHGLGLLMVEALLTLQGCTCVSLGVQTPIRDIVMAAKAHQAQVVALSFSLAFNPNQVLDGLAELRAQLQPDVEVWAGGRSGILHRREVPGVTILSDLKDLASHVDRWRSANATA
jgi:methanogenic corrinoid protein MtbC1